MNILTGRAGGALTNKLGVKMADTGVVRVGSNVTQYVRVVSGTEVATFGAVAVVSGVASCWEIFTGTVAGAETSTGTVVTGGSCAAWWRAARWRFRSIWDGPR